jgi:hypothetical protein
VWLVGVACSPDGSGRGQAGQRWREQQHRLRAARLSRQHDRRTRWRWKKHIPMGACNLRVVTGLGWASAVWLRAGTADRQRKSQTTKARSRRPVGLGQARYWHSRIGETLTRCLSEGSGAVDKLGMMRCVVCQAGPFRIGQPSLHPLQALRQENTDSRGVAKTI